MSRRKWWLFVGLTVLVVLTAILTPPTVAIRRGQRINRENFERIEEGMTQGEVEAILGQPPGDYTVFKQVFVEKEADVTPEVEIREGVFVRPRRRHWVSDKGLISITFMDGSADRYEFTDVGTSSIARR